MAGILALSYYIDIRTEANLVEVREAHSVEVQIEAIISDLSSVVSDLLVLSEQHELQRVLQGDEEERRTELRDLSNNFLSFSLRKGVYDQIRFLDETGMEVVRVNYNDGNPVIVPEEQLQSKAKRYYFEDTFLLAPGEVFVSPFDLNIEGGEIEKPLKPMIRFGTPVFDSSGEKRGVVLLNYFGARLLQNLETSSAGSLGETFLLNSDGFWLKGPRAEDEWGFMFEDRRNRTFGNAFPEAWQEISRAQSGQFRNSDGMFTFVTVHPLSEGWMSSTGSGQAFEPSTKPVEAGDYYWKLVSHVSPNVLSVISGRSLGQIFTLGAILAILLAIISWILARVSVRRQQAEEDIQRLNGELEHRLVELGAINRELETFSYSVSHDLRVPLRAIDGFSSALAEDYSSSLGKEGQGYLERVRAGVKNMNQLIEDLLNLSRIGRRPMNRRIASLEDVAKEAYQSLEQKWAKRKVNFVINPLPSVLVDPGLLGIVFTNLFSNALKFTRNCADAQIEVGSKIKDGEEIFFVKDNGVGFDMKYADKLFSPFQRLHSQEEYEGTGVGLATVRRIIHRHGGRIWAESRPGSGTTFYFTLQGNGLRGQET